MQFTENIVEEAGKLENKLGFQGSQILWTVPLKMQVQLEEKANNRLCQGSKACHNPRRQTLADLEAVKEDRVHHHKISLLEPF